MLPHVFLPQINNNRRKCIQENESLCWASVPVVFQKEFAFKICLFGDRKKIHIKFPKYDYLAKTTLSLTLCILEYN